ncbi:ABC transporter permease [Pseudomonas aeruginosa]|uniref:ABC transporter permease n=1 Tax=Pseudomonas aeruginosa TaxID=287 RepID=UPI000710F3CC|nr:ABC transporter permease [Pseudomonas aeruginosa]MBI8451490.1 ABC transporter permease [Pseudomonas aeruginosa]TEF29299.1 ABC transporter permease [Pseudomonas aeruginosa]TEF37112.1 ABC transporter permease [Pseudomonas aeruginosa]SOV26205.1 Spermidine/putrescine transport system permease p rotein PotB [Pseudomonas aeruginosa]HEJ2566235.1 ABC transporter permease [Pseudomonas aeruginosa]
MLTLKRQRQLQLFALLTPATVVISLFFLVPLGIMAIYSILEPGLYGGVEWSFYPDNFGRVLGWADGTLEEFDSVYLWIFLRSLRLALTTVLLSLAVCYPMAFWVRKQPENRRNLCLFLITLPFFTSLIVRLYAWVLILRPSGFLNQLLLGFGVIESPLDVIYTETAVLIGMVYVSIPFMFLPLYASIEKLDSKLIEASRDLGASSWQTFRRVVFPLTLPGIAAGAVIVFIPSLGNFIVPSLLGGARVVMIGNLVEQQFLAARNWPFGAALSMLIMTSVLLLLIAHTRRSSRQEALA